MSTPPRTTEPPTPPLPEPIPPRPRRATPKEKSALDQWVSKLRWEVYRLLPSLAPPLSAGDIAYQEEHDKKLNAESRTPAGFELRCSTVWGVELYGPSEIESLYDGIRKLGWSRIASFDPDDSAVDHIRRMRSSGPGGWLNIGHVVPSDTKAPALFMRNTAPLPDGVSSLNVGVFQVTASLTAVLIGFELADNLPNRYEEEINRDRTTYRRPEPRLRAIRSIDPLNQKQDAINTVRSELRGVVGNWFAYHLPGYFSDLGRPAEFPSMELLLANGPVLEGPDKAAVGSWREWRRLLANLSPHEVWTYETDPGLQLAFERSHDTPRGLHIIAALDTNVFSDERIKSFGEDRTRAYAFRCHDYLGGILVHSATVEYLREQLRDVNLTRERMREARSGRKHFSRTLDEIGDFFDRMLGSSVVARELMKKSKEVGWYRHECETFTSPAWNGDKRDELHEGISKQVRILSTQLAEEEGAIRDHFEQLSTVLSVRESISAQRRMERLTVLALVVALASLAIALPGLSEWIKSL